MGEHRARLLEIKAKRERDPTFQEPHIERILKKICPEKEMEDKPKDSWELKRQPPTKTIQYKEKQHPTQTINVPTPETKHPV